MNPSRLEALARELEQSPDYRILRRLDPASLYREVGVAVAPADAIRGVIVDVETTGLDLNDDEVIELGIVPFVCDSAGRLLTALPGLSALRDPGRPIPAESSRIHGITDAMVSGQSIDAKQVAALVGDAQLVIAHNAGFDRPMCEKAWPIFARRPWACSLVGVPWRDLDSSGNRLGNLLADVGLFHEAHRAEEDCQALLAVLTAAQAGLDGGTALHYLWTNRNQERRRIFAARAPFAAKDLLKERGYRWKAEDDDAGPKSWWRELPLDDVPAEGVWLREAIYGGRRVALPMDRINALNRFSDRRDALGLVDV